MKRLAWFDKIVFTINAIFIFLLLITFVVPYISSEELSFLSFLGLLVPFLVGVNFLFLLYWIIRKKRQLWLSLSVLIFGYFSLGTFIKFKFSENKVIEEDLSVMSYNVKAFNRNGIPNHLKTYDDFKTFISKEDPDIVCLQEVGYVEREKHRNYPYQFSEYTKKSNKAVLSIFSKYPILKAELIHFPETANNGSYADILYKNDTIRVYNIHFQSFKIIPSREVLEKESTGSLYKRLKETFQKQQEQADIINEHFSSTPYKKIICGDFNNSQFSNIYRTIKGEKQDTFMEEGSGYGKTFSLLGIPLRIDFILGDTTFEVTSHKNYNEKLSDHFPVMASFSMKSE